MCSLQPLFFGQPFFIHNEETNTWLGNGAGPLPTNSEDCNQVANLTLNPVPQGQAITEVAEPYVVLDSNGRNPNAGQVPTAAASSDPTQPMQFLNAAREKDPLYFTSKSASMGYDIAQCQTTNPYYSNCPIISFPFIGQQGTPAFPSPFAGCCNCHFAALGGYLGFRMGPPYSSFRQIYLLSATGSLNLQAAPLSQFGQCKPPSFYFTTGAQGMAGEYALFPVGGTEYSAARPPPAVGGLNTLQASADWQGTVGAGTFTFWYLDSALQTPQEQAGVVAGLRMQDPKSSYNYTTGPCWNEPAACAALNATSNTQASSASACAPTMPTLTNSVVPCTASTLPCSSKSTQSPNTCGNDWPLYFMVCGGGPSFSTGNALAESAESLVEGLSDFHGQEISSGNVQYMCSALNDATCPKMGSASAAFVDWYQPKALNATVGLVQCTYNTADLVTSDTDQSSTNVNAWLSTFTTGATGASGAQPIYDVDSVTDQGFQNLMYDYCQQQVSNCIGGLTKCSRVYEDVPNNVCSRWYQDVQAKAKAGDPTAYAISNNFFQTYCANNPDSADCKCYTSINSQAYGVANQTEYTPSEIGCFWTPCMYSPLNPTLVPAYMFPTGSCPQQVCENIVAALKNADITDSTIDQYMSCSGGGVSPAAPPGPFGVPWSWWIGGVVGLVVVVALIFLAIGLRKVREKRLKAAQLSPTSV